MTATPPLAAAPTSTPTPIPTRRPSNRQFPLAPQEVMVRDAITGHLLCAEYRHEKLRTRGRGDRFKVYHPLFGTHGFRWVKHQNFNILGNAASPEDHEKHARQHDPATVGEE